MTAAAHPTGKGPAQESADAARRAASFSDEAEPEDPVGAALARLEASRAGLRQIMIPPRRTARRAAAGAAAAGAGEGSIPGETGGSGFSQWLPEAWQDALEDATSWLRRHPVSALLVDGVQSWWNRHPLRHAAAMAGEEVSAVASPLIRRHPVAAVGVAAAVGALVVVGKPWRWRVFGGSERPLSRRMMRWVSSQIPLQAALGALMALVLDQARQAATQGAEAAPDPVAQPPRAAARAPAQGQTEPHPRAPAESEAKAPQASAAGL